MSKKAKRKIILSLELIQALAGFKPTFANEEDIRISLRLGNLYRDLETVDNEVFRDPKKKKTWTDKMKSIEYEEKRLIESIIKRNMDF